MADRVEADAVAEIAKRAVAPTLIKVGTHLDSDGDVIDTNLITVPKDAQVCSIKKLIDEYRDAPERREGTARLATLESFIAWTTRNAGPACAGSTEPAQGDSAAIFADVLSAKPSLTAVIDYHRPGPAGAARFLRHRGLYPFPLSDEWCAWQENQKTAMTQGAFAEFLENRIVDVVDPSGALDSAKKLSTQLGADFAGPAKLLELSRGLSVRVNSRVAAAKNLSSGEVQFAYETSHADEAGHPLRVPSAFLIEIPIFQGAATLYQLAVRLRYRVKDGSVAWFYEIPRAQENLRDALREAAEKAEKDTGLPLFFGTPEA